MSKARLIITAVIVEGRSQAEVARAYGVALVDDLHVRIINATTGELLRDLTIDTKRDYQPTGAPKGPTRPKTRRPEPS
jgi:hypothetical protein